MMLGKACALLLAAGLALPRAEAADVSSYAGTYEGHLSRISGLCDGSNRVFSLVVDAQGAARMLYNWRRGDALEGSVDSTGAVKMTATQSGGRYNIRFDMNGTITGDRVTGRITTESDCIFSIDLQRP